jgi:hypothetical protein
VLDERRLGRFSQVKGEKKTWERRNHTFFGGKMARADLGVMET